MTVKATYNNDKIFFNEVSLNNLQYPIMPVGSTPLEQLLGLSSINSLYHVHWVLYAQNVFPSLRNEYLSRSLERIGFDNKFWRDNLIQRVNIGTGSTNSFNISVSQSAWPLDAQEDFLTRTGPVTIDTAGAPYAELISKGKAGECQNNYVHVHTGSGATVIASIRSLRPGALYARKHLLPSPKSVVSPSGMPIPETGSLTDPFGDGIEIFAGEAKWEADSQAGIVVKSGNTSTFQASASAPWFNSYGDFNADLKLVAKDYSIIPEFRISEHVEDYVKYGLLNPGKLDTFEIPGTNKNSSTASFYKDYSNSEFMDNFTTIRGETSLPPTEIRLVCNAAVRFIPYKGFYPAQRTLDLINQFSKSYGPGFVSTRGAGNVAQETTGRLRPLIQPLFAPGVLYNSIKSGIAVDFPVVTDKTKLAKDYFGATSATGNWMITSANTASTDTSGSEGYSGGKYWDYRVPFEALVTPTKYISNVRLYDLEPHPSASLDVTASLNDNTSDNIYPLMADNFFGQVATFFLKDKSYTKLQSEIVADDLRFETGSVYGARLKMYRSTTGPRTYQNESGSSGTNGAYSIYGGRSYVAFNKFGTGSFPLPQDPRQNPDFRETFTMYSRPTAFGPPVAGRLAQTLATASATISANVADGLNGFNWAFTPPYYNGEAWVDFIFRPEDGVSYDLERMLAETTTVLWRCDPGISASAGSVTSTQLLKSFDNAQLIYEGKNVNDNAMQLDASVNYLGVERVMRQRKDKFGNEIMSENETVGKRWIIQPKWETPMLNFNNLGIHPITNADSTLTLPTYGSASVPRGMWHQFGVIPDAPSKGVFLEMGDIPVNWLKNHYKVIDNSSVYNNHEPIVSGATVYQNMKSLTDVIGFGPTNTKKRLGELPEKISIKEGVVAIPYILDSVENPAAAPSSLRTERKKFINIPNERVLAAMENAYGSAAGDSLDASGESIRKLVQKMKRFVLPPQVDWLNNKDISPIAMYIFEFEYELDRDDLSYIWQNLAPRESKKMVMTSESIAHKLDNNELLSADNLNHSNLRWMVFKVKQRAEGGYSSLVAPQVGESTINGIFDFKDQTNGYDAKFNWPYDYFSFVELINMDTEVLYHNAGSGSAGGGGGMY